MSFAYPWVLALGLFSVVALVVAHLLSVTDPQPLDLPTARFVPSKVVRAISRASRPRDILLLILRCLALVMAALALSGVSCQGRKLPVVGVVVVDLNGFDSSDSAVWRGDLKKVVNEYSPVSAIVINGSTVFIDDPMHAESIADTLSFVVFDNASLLYGTPGLSGGLLAARRTATEIATLGDSIRLVVLSALKSDEANEALSLVRSLWPGKIDLNRVNIENLTDSSVRGSAAIDVRTSLTNDPVSAAAKRWHQIAVANTRIVRDNVTADDSTFAEQGNVLVEWPAIVSNDGMHNRGIIARGISVVAPVVMANRTNDLTRSIAWWEDGSKAVGESVLGNGCVRTVNFDIKSSDILFTDAARGLMSVISSRCGGSNSLIHLSDSMSKWVESFGDRENMLDATSLDFNKESQIDYNIVRWLLISTIILLFAELMIRRSWLRL